MSPLAVTTANAAGAAAAGLYVPVIMSVLYDRAKRSGTAYRFHLAAEAGWDIGAVAGCLAAASVVWCSRTASLAMLPAALGIIMMYACVRAETDAAPASRQVPAAS